MRCSSAPFILLLLLLLFCISLNGADVPSDSLPEGAKKDSLRDTALALLAHQFEPYYSSPRSADTLLGLHSLYSYTLTRSDYFHWEDLLRHSPSWIPVYYTPRSHLNTALFRGYTVPLKGNRHSRLRGIYTPTLAFLPSPPVRAGKVETGNNGALKPLTRISPVAATDIFFATETGLFNGNTLDARLIRNLTPELTLGVSMSFMHLDSMDFDHNSGSMYQFYRNIGIPQTHISDTGTNPLSLSRQTTMDLIWDTTEAAVSFTYADLRHDIPQTIPVDTRDTTLFIRNKDFYARMEAEKTHEITHASDITVSALAEHITNRQSAGIPNQQLTRGGSNSYQGAAAEYRYSATDNTHLLFSSRFNRLKTKHYTDDTTIIHTYDFLVGDSLVGDNFTLDIRGGGTYIHDGRTDRYFAPLLHGEGDYSRNNLSFSAWFSADMHPLTVPYDSAETRPIHELSEKNSPYRHPYTGAGAELIFKKSRFELRGSFSRVKSPDEEQHSWYMPGSLPIADMPTDVVSLGGSLGKLGPLLLTHDTYLSNTAPHIRNLGGLRLVFTPPSRHRTVYTDLMYAYWSKRTHHSFFDSRDWNKEIIHISAKFAAEIKTFRFYLKADNILNRNHAYVTGYEMPGITFRWGFSWSIKG